jgi:hypothetical protein
MHASVVLGFAFWTELVWAVPAIGFVVACAAFVFGRRVVARPPKENAAPHVESPVDVFLHGSATDRRAAPRRRGNTVEVLLSRGPDQTPIHGWVQNRSMGGLCLRVEQPVEEGKVIEIRPLNASDLTPWTPVEIRTCRAGDGEWEVGCKFVKTPQYNVLLLFG